MGTIFYLCNVGSQMLPKTPMESPCPRDGKYNVSKETIFLLLEGGLKDAVQVCNDTKIKSLVT